MSHSKDHKSLVHQALKRPGVKREYDKLEGEFALLEKELKPQKGKFSNELKQCQK